MKKPIKIILSIIIVALLCWIVFCSIDGTYTLKPMSRIVLSIIISTLLYGTAVIVTNKNIPKIIKVLVIIIIIALLCWIAVIRIDMYRMENLEEPIFAKMVDGDKTTYKGWGYRIEIEYGIGSAYGPDTEGVEEQFIGATMYMFNKMIAAVIT